MVPDHCPTPARSRKGVYSSRLSHPAGLGGRCLPPIRPLGPRWSHARTGFRSWRAPTSKPGSEAPTRCPGVRSSTSAGRRHRRPTPPSSRWPSPGLSEHRRLGEPVRVGHGCTKCAARPACVAALEHPVEPTVTALATGPRRRLGHSVDPPPCAGGSRRPGTQRESQAVRSTHESDEKGRRRLFCGLWSPKLRDTPWRVKG